MEEKNFPSLLADGTHGHSKRFYCCLCKWPAPVCKRGWQSFQDKKFSLHVLCFLCASEPGSRMQSILCYSRGENSHSLVLPVMISEYSDLPKERGCRHQGVFCLFENVCIHLTSLKKINSSSYHY